MRLVVSPWPVIVSQVDKGPAYADHGRRIMTGVRTPTSDDAAAGVALVVVTFVVAVTSGAGLVLALVALTLV